MKNHEGYTDMTAYKAIKRVQNEEKKEYLSKYQKVENEIDRVLKSIYVLKNREVNVTAKINGMPRARSHHDLSDYVSLLNEKENKLIELQKKRETIKNEIKQRVEKLENQNEHDVIILRYINTFKWEHIADIMCYSVQHVHKIHASALMHFEI